MVTSFRERSSWVGQKLLSVYHVHCSPSPSSSPSGGGGCFIAGIRVGANTKDDEMLTTKA
jgi:hypothetical protein